MSGYVKASLEFLEDGDLHNNTRAFPMDKDESACEKLGEAIGFALSHLHCREFLTAAKIVNTLMVCETTPGDDEEKRLLNDLYIASREYINYWADHDRRRDIHIGT